ncbi:MAG: class I SAM-dependent methyltransferase [Acidobacteriota bacterium]|nr:class I SAM-dependent methyltransferase [Acidobacteriota bacterium]
MRFSGQQRIARAQTFDQIAELYDRGRREPPAWVYSTLFEKTRLNPASARILEAGCGTGKSTLPLARKGAHVVALEMGANLARLAKLNLALYPRVEVLHSRFEDFSLDERFDLVLAVTSWHWLDPAQRYKCAFNALKPGGWLAFTTGGHAFPPDYDPFFRDIQRAYEAVGADTIPWPPPPPDAFADSKEEIAQSGLFTDVQVYRHLWKEEFSTDEYIALLETASDHRLMEPDKRGRLFAAMRVLISARPGGRIVKHNITLLHLARKPI